MSVIPFRRPVADGARQPNEPKQEINKAAIERLAKLPQGSRDIYVQDAELPGFKLRRTPNGTITFCFAGRIKGGEGVNKNKTIKRTLGTGKGAGAISVAKASAEASRLRDELARGIDPDEDARVRAGAAEAAQQQRAIQEQVRLWTPAYSFAHMLEWRQSRPDLEQRLKPATVTAYRRGIGYLGKLANVPIVELTDDDIRKALDRIGGAAKASKAKGALSAVAKHAIKRLNLNIPNPVSRLDRGEFKARPPRESYVSESDIGAFVDAVLRIETGNEVHTKRARDYMLLTLLCGTRKEELMRMEWAWVDWQADTFTVPSTVTKQKRKHCLPLTDWTRAILRRRLSENREGAVYVFPGNVKGKPLTNIRRSLQRAVGKEFKIHDARRTLMTHCSSLGIHGGRLKAIVGHAKTGVTENYDQREIAQVRRDLTTYHDWVKNQHETWWQIQEIEKDPEWAELLRNNPKTEEPEHWPGG